MKRSLIPYMNELSQDVKTMLHPIAVEQRVGKNYVKFIFEAAGIAKEDIDISFDKKELTVVFKKTEEPLAEDERFAVRRRIYGSFTQKFYIDFPTDPEKMQADFTNGVLTILVPKIPEADDRTHIEVK